MRSMIYRLTEIGCEIANLTTEAKYLRAEVFDKLTGIVVPHPAEEGKSYRFLCDDMLVTVKQDGKEHTVLIDDLERLD